MRNIFRRCGAFRRYVFDKTCLTRLDQTINLAGFAAASAASLGWETVEISNFDLRQCAKVSIAKQSLTGDKSGCHQQSQNGKVERITGNNLSSFGGYVEVGPTQIQSVESVLTTGTGDGDIDRPMALAYSEANSTLSGYCSFSSRSNLCASTV